ncbi:MAG TPA: arylesterase [Xanthomonadaceae bacterium]|jgi:acyl-CoA thioesterase-1|nr:arylesterase [Xanthomonadaceae bacterium]
MADRSGEYHALWALAPQQGVTALRALTLGFVLAALAGCAGPGDAERGDTPSAASAAAAESAPVAPIAASPAPDAVIATRNILVFGDSLSAAYNLAAEQGWVALLDARMRSEAPGYRMVNASISGETTAGGVSRIDAALAEHQPALLVLALGANDGLRGLPLEQTRGNLERMVRAAKASGSDVLVVGMRLPPNYGPAYTSAFFTMFGELARAEGVAHLPFLLEPIALDDSAFQPDRLHPTADAQPVLAQHVWATLGPMLRSRANTSASSRSPRASSAGTALAALPASGGTQAKATRLL